MAEASPRVKWDIICLVLTEQIAPDLLAFPVAVRPQRR